MTGCGRLARRWVASAVFGQVVLASVEDPLERGLAGDDECRAEGGDGRCTLSALQMRSARTRDPPEAGNGMEASPKQCSNDAGAWCITPMHPCPESLGATDCVRGKCLCQAGSCMQDGVCVETAYGECSRNTGGSCKHFRCDASRGPTSCDDDGRCMCAAGLCAQDGACALPQSVLTARVVRIDEAHPKFPEAQSDIRTALCFSGGGARSLSLVVGALRALENLGLMKGVDAISSVSGGSWASGVYMYADVPTDELLGAPTTPSELTLEALRAAPARLGAAATTDTEAIAMRLISRGEHPERLWQHTVTAAFLEPFGLDGVAFMAKDAAAVERIRQQNPQLGEAQFVVPVPGRPRVFVMGGALLAPTGHLASKANVVNFQISPDYSGSPFGPGERGVAYESDDSMSEALDKQPLGGGMVETFAFGSAAPVDSPTDSGEVRLRAPTLPFTLGDALGVSSAAFASKLASKKYAPDAVVPKANVWHVAADRFAARVFSLGDGGNVENSGVLAMMQRKAQRIVWWINTDTPIKLHAPYCKGNVEESQIPGSVTNQFYDKFGYGDFAAEFYSHNQVFAKEEFQPLVCSLQKLVGAGKPAIVRKTMEVQANDWWGITPYSVDIVFVYNERCSNFETLLPADTQKSLEQGAHGDFAHFPNFKTMFNNGPRAATTLSGAQINLLAAQAEYGVQQNADLFKDLLGA